MSAFPQHPSLVLAVTPQERQAALQRLRVAYEDGMLSGEDFDRRAGMAEMAQSRRDLNTAFLGLVDVTPEAARLGMVPAGRGLAVAAHVSGWFFFLVGPLVCYAVAPVGSYARHEAAKAVNLSVVTLLALVVAVGVTLVDEQVGMPLLLLFGGCWWLTSLVAALQAGKGNDWDHPLAKWLPLQLVKG